MRRETVGRKTEARIHHPATKHGKERFELIESYLPAGSPQRAAAGVATAVVGALLAAAVLGVGPAALAASAGYVVYHETHR